MSKTRSQQTMASAYKMALAVKNTEDISVACEYKKLCEAIPAMLLQVGALTTVAYLEAKAVGNGDRAEACQLLKGHLSDHIGVSEGSLVETLKDCSTEQLMLYSEEMLDLFVYLKRFSVSILGKLKCSESADEVAGP